MPKPTKVETDEPTEDVETKQPQPTTEVEVDVATGKPVVAKAPVEPSVSVEEFNKMKSRYEYQQRQNEKSQRDLVERIEKLQAPQPASPAETPVTEGEVYGMSKEELNQLGQNDWTKPVQKMAEKIADERAEKKFKALMAEQTKQQQEQLRQQQTTNILEREKQWVLEQSPSLNDETSDDFRGFYQTYNRMVTEDPTLLQNPRSPRLVYREWKAEAPGTPNVQADPEKERLKRVAGGVSPQGRPSPAQKTIKLSQEELDFCERTGLSPQALAQSKAANLKEGVSA